jgi:hypothetical protein
MTILGIQGMTEDDVRGEMARGGRFVIYQYCVSIIILTLKRSSNIYFIRGGHSSFAKGFPFIAISLFLGWWGIPWGPIYTVQSLVTNFAGGRDVTQQVLASLRPPVPPPSGSLTNQ